MSSPESAPKCPRCRSPVDETIFRSQAMYRRVCTNLECDYLECGYL